MRRFNFRVLAEPWRVFSPRFHGALLALLALMLLLYGQWRPATIEAWRAGTADALLPVLAAVAEPLRTADRIGDEIHALTHLREENLALRDEVLRLKAIEQQAQQLAMERETLAHALNLRPDPGLSFITARAITQSGGPYSQSILAAAGLRDGVAAGMAVLAENHLAGRVLTVGERASRVLLLTDPSSRVPVMLPDGVRAILAGDGTGELSLLYLPDDALPAVGTRIVTSGHGGVFPPGLAVGVISRADAEKVMVAPYAALNRLQFLHLVSYGGAAPPTAP